MIITMVISQKLEILSFCLIFLFWMVQSDYVLSVTAVIKLILMAPVHANLIVVVGMVTLSYDSHSARWEHSRTGFTVKMRCQNLSTDDPLTRPALEPGCQAVV